MSRFTGESITSAADLWGHAAANWNFEDAATGLFITLRGHVGEGLAAAHLEQAGMSVVWPDRSNEPGLDLVADGNDLQVKIVSDGGRAAAEHFDRYPDIPIILNADADNIPDGAIWFNPEHGIDPALLVGENIVIVDESLTLDSVTAQLTEVFPAVDPGEYLVDLAEPAVGVGILIAVVQSGLREGRLVSEGRTDRSRAVKNVTVDAASRTAGVIAGAKAGGLAGAQLDLAAGGSTLGLGTVGGTILGAFAGVLAGRKVANHIRLRPLAARSSKHRLAIESYSRALEDEGVKVNRALARADANARLLLAAKAVLARRTLEARISEAKRNLAAARRVDVDRVLATVAADVRDRALRLDRHVITDGRAPRIFLRAAAKSAAEKWIDEARTLSRHTERSPEGLAAFWDHLSASPAGLAAMNDYIERVGTERNRELRQTLALGTSLAAETGALRPKIRANMERAVNMNVITAQAHLTPHTRRLRETSDELRRELLAAGAELEE